MTRVDEIVTVLRVDNNDALEALRNLDATARVARRSLEQIKVEFIEIKDELLEPIEISTVQAENPEDEQDGITVPITIEVETEDITDDTPEDIDIDLNSRNTSSVDTLKLDPEITLQEQKVQDATTPSDSLQQQTTPDRDVIVQPKLSITNQLDHETLQSTNIQNVIAAAQQETQENISQELDDKIQDDASVGQPPQSTEGGADQQDVYEEEQQLGNVVQQSIQQDITQIEQQDIAEISDVPPRQEEEIIPSDDIEQVEDTVSEVPESLDDLQDEIEPSDIPSVSTPTGAAADDEAAVGPQTEFRDLTRTSVRDDTERDKVQQDIVADDVSTSPAPTVAQESETLESENLQDPEQLENQPGLESISEDRDEASQILPEFPEDESASSSTDTGDVESYNEQEPVEPSQVDDETKDDINIGPSEESFEQQDKTQGKPTQTTQQASTDDKEAEDFKAWMQSVMSRIASSDFTINDPDAAGVTRAEIQEMISASLGNL